MVMAVIEERREAGEGTSMDADGATNQMPGSPLRFEQRLLLDFLAKIYLFLQITPLICFVNRVSI